MAATDLATPSMGAKRQFDGGDVQDDGSGKRRKQYIGRKRQPKEDSGTKKRIRAIERALRRYQAMPANVRVDLERELDAQKRTAEDKAYRKKRSTMISRYHMVRFFERKKASRLVTQLRRKLEYASDPSEADRIRHVLHVAEVDEAYTLYFPHVETYVGLYSASAKLNDEGQTVEEKLTAAKAALAAEKPPMWSVVEKALKDGPDALQKLRDRRSPDGSGEVDDTRPPMRPPPPPAPISAPTSRPASIQKPEKQPASKKAGSSDNSNRGLHPELNRRERRKLMRETATANNDDDDEGGFFEGL